jgi:hypothetical protein
MLLALPHVEATSMLQCAFAGNTSPNYAFERAGLPSARARVRLSCTSMPSARLKRLRPAAQRER